MIFIMKATTTTTMIIIIITIHIILQILATTMMLMVILLIMIIPITPPFPLLRVRAREALGQNIMVNITKQHML